MDGFTGFPVAALDFYDDLEMDNTRSFWEKHKEVYEQSVRAPMVALTAALAPEFAPDGKTTKVFRPYRDVRFSKDKTPYKTHQGAYVAAGAGAPAGTSRSRPRACAPAPASTTPRSPRLAAFREAVDDERRGGELEQLLADLAAAGFEIGGDRLKTAPRGYTVDHPRIELLRHKTLSAGRSHGFEPHIHTPGLLDSVREDWRTLRPLVEWVQGLRGE